MNAEQRFDQFFGNLGLEFFRPHEFRFLGGSHYLSSGKAAGLNGLPPRALWENMVPMARAADEIRRRFGRPIRILSAYRTPGYNAAVGGARASYHMAFCALDLAPMAGGVAELHRVARAVRREGGFSGGIGRYASFVHVDGRGDNVDF